MLKEIFFVAIIFLVCLFEASGQQKGTLLFEPYYFDMYAKNREEIHNQYITSEPLLKTFLSNEKFRAGARYGAGLCYFVTNNLGIFLDFGYVTTQYFHAGSIEYDTHTQAVKLIQDYNFRCYGVGLRKTIPIHRVVSFNADYSFSYWQHINHSDGYLLSLKKSHLIHSFNAGLGFKLNNVFSVNTGIMAGLSQGDMAAQSSDNMIDFKPIFFGLGIKLQIKLANENKS